MKIAPIAEHHINRTYSLEDGTKPMITTCDMEFLDEGNRVDQPTEFETLSTEHKDMVLDWIARTIMPARSIPLDTSYGMKHWLEEEIGLYVSNGAFKGAMLRAGYKPLNPNALNWRFRYRMKLACQGFTLNSKPCKRQAMAGCRVCWSHYRFNNNQML